MGGDGDNLDFVVLCDPPTSELQAMDMAGPLPQPRPFPCPLEAGQVRAPGSRPAEQPGTAVCQAQTLWGRTRVDSGLNRPGLCREPEPTALTLTLRLPGAGSGHAGATLNSAEQTGGRGPQWASMLQAPGETSLLLRPSPGWRNPPTGLGSSALLRVHCFPCQSNRKLPSQQPSTHKGAPRPSQVNTRSQAPHRHR